MASSKKKRAAAGKKAPTKAKPVRKPLKKQAPAKKKPVRKAQQAARPEIWEETTMALGQAQAAPIPKPQEVAALIGVLLQPALKPEISRHLLRPYPGFRAVMDNVSANIRIDNDVLELPYDPDEIDRRLAYAKDLSIRNSILEQVLAGSDGARQVEDSFLMKVLFDSVKRVNEESTTHPEIKQRWQEILDFVRKNRPGRTGGGSSGGSGGGTPSTGNENG